MLGLGDVISWGIDKIVGMGYIDTNFVGFKDGGWFDFVG